MASRALTLVLLASGCVQTTSTAVMGPDGGKAILIEAPDQREALGKAHEECPDGYEILTVTTSADRQAFSTTRELLIRCKHGGQSEWSTASTEPVDPQPCRSAAREADDFIDYWADFTHAQPVDKRPPNDEFIDLCQQMPPSLKPCFKKSYRKAHGQLCTGLFGRLDETRKGALDAALLQKNP
jgi:hypothetical protein